MSTQMVMMMIAKVSVMPKVLVMLKCVDDVKGVGNINCVDDVDLKVSMISKVKLFYFSSLGIVLKAFCCSNLSMFLVSQS